MADPAGHEDGGQPQAWPASALDMPRALRVIAVTGLLGAGVSCLLPGALVAGESGGLALLMLPLLTLGSLYAYRRFRPPLLVSVPGGTRFGALLGLWMGSLIGAATGIAGFVLRYARHSRAMDDRISQAVAQVPMQIRAAGPVPPEVLQLLQTPEFRAGTFIFGHVFSLLLLVITGAACGWMAATLLHARRQRSIE